MDIQDTSLMRLDEIKALSTMINRNLFGEFCTGHSDETLPDVIKLRFLQSELNLCNTLFYSMGRMLDELGETLQELTAK
jgi:hypothetical protein